MDVINGLAPATDLFIEVEPNDELGAPADPTSLAVEVTFSATRRLGGTPTWVSATWQTDTDAVPPRYYAKAVIVAGDLTEGVWWPFVRIHNAPEVPILAGLPFRIEGGPTPASPDLPVSSGLVVVHKFAFAFDTPGLVDGIDAYQPSVGDVLLSAWVATDEVWDGTTPRVDFGTFNGSDEGILRENPEWGQAQPLDVDPGTAGGVRETWAGLLFGVTPELAIGTFISTDPIKVVVSQDGRAGGVDPGATQGAATFYVMVATPASQ